jgi:hypothetical protein
MSTQWLPANLLTGKILARSSFSFFKLFIAFVILLKLASPSDAAGPLTVNHSNPRYFFDSTGAAVYLAGVYIDEYNLLSNGSSNFSAHLDVLQEHNHNFTRVWAWEQSPWFFAETGQISFQASLTSEPARA